MLVNVIIKRWFIQLLIQSDVSFRVIGIFCVLRLMFLSLIVGVSRLLHAKCMVLVQFVYCFIWPNIPLKINTWTWLENWAFYSDSFFLESTLMIRLTKNRGDFEIWNMIPFIRCNNQKYLNYFKCRLQFEFCLTLS